MNRNVEIWCAWPKCKSNLMWICIKWTTNWCLLIPNTSMTGQTWCIKLQIYRRMYVYGVRKMLHRSIVVCFFFYVIIYIFSRCVCAYTIIDRSACTEERKTFFLSLLLSMPVLSVVVIVVIANEISSCTTNTKAQAQNTNTEARIPGQSIRLHVPANRKESKTTKN